MRTGVAATVLMLLLTGSSAWGQGNAASAELWKKRCAVCHGADGRGKTHTGEKYAIPDLTTASWQASRTDGQIRTLILQGGENMPGFAGKLSREEVDGLVRHVRSLGKATAGR